MTGNGSFPLYSSKFYPISSLKPSPSFLSTKDYREKSCTQKSLSTYNLCEYFLDTSSWLPRQITSASYMLSPQNPQEKKSVLVLLSPSALLSSLGIQGREFKGFSDPRYNIVWEKLISLNDTTVTYITHVNNS